MVGFLVKVFAATFKLIFDCFAGIYSFALWIIGAAGFLGICIIPVLLFLSGSKTQSLVLLSIVSIGWVIFAAKLLQIFIRRIDSRRANVYDESVTCMPFSHVGDDLLKNSNAPSYGSKVRRNAAVPNTPEHIKKYGTTDVYGSVD